MYVSPAKPGMHRILLFPHEKEVVVPLKQLYRRRVQSRFIYVIQRYYGIVGLLITITITITITIKQFQIQIQTIS